MKYAKTRAQAVEMYSKFLMNELTTGYERIAKEAVDAGYCEGYNTVLEAAEEVLSPEDYKKLVDYLNENGM